MTSRLVEVRCPLPSLHKAGEACNKLCVRVQPGSSGKAYCSRHDTEFEFQIDDSRTFSANDIKSQVEKP
jgi:hypothetical protein